MLLKVNAAHYGTTAILVVEGRALRDVLLSIIQEGFNKVLVEADKRIVIQALEGITQTSWWINNIIRDIRTWSNQSLLISIKTHFQRSKYSRSLDV